MSKRTLRVTAISRAKSILASTLSHHDPRPQVPPGGGESLDERRHAMIEHAAYFLAEHRGFEPGHELEDWCEAERQVDAQLFRGDTPAM